MHKHKVCYCDGTTDWYDLSKQRYTSVLNDNEKKRTDLIGGKIYANLQTIGVGGRVDRQGTIEQIDERNRDALWVKVKWEVMFGVEAFVETHNGDYNLNLELVKWGFIQNKSLQRRSPHASLPNSQPSSQPSSQPLSRSPSYSPAVDKRDRRDSHVASSAKKTDTPSVASKNAGKQAITQKAVESVKLTPLSREVTSLGDHLSTGLQGRSRSRNNEINEAPFKDHHHQAGHDRIGECFEMYWDRKWFASCLSQYNQQKGEHKAFCEDGTFNWVNMKDIEIREWSAASLVGKVRFTRAR